MARRDIVSGAAQTNDIGLICIIIALNSDLDEFFNWITLRNAFLLS
jgi:hypothetical protein